MIIGFVHEYTYRDCEYRIRTMNTKHAQCTCYTFGRSVLLLQAAQKIASVVLSTSVIKLVRQCYQLLANKSALNTTRYDNYFLSPFALKMREKKRLTHSY